MRSVSEALSVAQTHQQVLSQITAIFGYFRRQAFKLITLISIYRVVARESSPESTSVHYMPTMKIAIFQDDVECWDGCDCDVETCASRVFQVSITD